MLDSPNRMTEYLLHILQSEANASSVFFFKPLFILGGLYWEHVLFCNNALLHSHMQSYLKAAQSKHTVFYCWPQRSLPEGSGALLKGPIAEAGVRSSL